ncbi:Response regulator [Gammaproteobacteria bacterium]
MAMSTDIRTKTILIIDDMTSVRSALRHIFASMGAMKVELAADGDEALRRMASTPYDIILCDYNLGENRDGMQVFEEAKQRHLVGLSTVFIMITGEASLAMVLGVVEYRPDEYLIKPITRQMLEERLDPVVARKMVLVDIEKAVRDGDLPRAVAMAGAQLQAQPAHALDLLRVRAELLLRLGQFDAAGESFETAARIRETFWTKLGRGQVRYYLGDYTTATQIFQGLIAENRMNTEAYDWLARVYQATGNPEAAKEALSSAAQISPRSILRAQALGALSLRAGDTAVAEQAYRNAVRLGRFSVYRDPSDNAHLSRVFMERGNSKEATRTIKEARKQYSGDPKASLVLAIAEASAYQQLGLHDAAVKSMNEANAVYQSAGADLPPDLAMELAKICHTNGNDKQASVIMSDTVNRHVEDTALMEQAKEVYGTLGMAQDGEALISTLWAKVAAANNEGVRLVREGRLNEAIVLLEKAAREMPRNPTINMNAARVLLLAMEKLGRRADLLARAKEYLDRVPAAQGTHDDKFQRLRGTWVKLATQSQPGPDASGKGQAPQKPGAEAPPKAQAPQKPAQAPQKPGPEAPAKAPVPQKPGVKG